VRKKSEKNKWGRKRKKRVRKEKEKKIY